MEQVTGAFTWSGTIRSFVALGDSFAEGMVDNRPDGSIRGWADRVAERLAAIERDLVYANLSVRGKLIRQISDDQVPVALGMRADLVSLSGGLNDIARPGCDIEQVCAELARCTESLAKAAGRVLMFQPMDFTRRMPSMERFAPRVRVLMDCVERLKARYGVVVVDLSVERVFDDPRMWAPDRVHPSAEGHRRIAEAVLEALGYETAFDWRASLPPARRKRALARMWGDIVWSVRFVAPWLKRRITGTSSGDGMPPKRPELSPVLGAVDVLQAAEFNGAESSGAESSCAESNGAEPSRVEALGAQTLAPEPIQAQAA